MNNNIFTFNGNFNSYEKENIINAVKDNLVFKELFKTNLVKEIIFTLKVFDESLNRFVMSAELIFTDDSSSLFETIIEGIEAIDDGCFKTNNLSTPIQEVKYEYKGVSRLIKMLTDNVEIQKIVQIPQPYKYNIVDTKEVVIKDEKDNVDGKFI